MNPKLFTQNNYFFMLALDHRGSFEKLAQTTDEKTLINLKLDIINSLIYQFSGILIDKNYGFKAYSLINKDILKPFLLPIEKSGYKESGEGRLNELETSAGEIRDLGGSGVKLLIYFNKKDKNSKKQIELAKVVGLQCRQENIPFFLEIVNYAETKDVLDTVSIFKQEGIAPSVFKLEYPGNAKNCLELTNLLEDTPWILLSQGVTFKEFYNQNFIASQNGCMGFLAGRSLWQEIFELEGEKKSEFLSTELPKRFKKLKELYL
jgi:tagatose-1,6-bisphosphate aldolase